MYCCRRVFCCGGKAAGKADAADKDDDGDGSRTAPLLAEDEDEDLPSVAASTGAGPDVVGSDPMGAMWRPKASRARSSGDGDALASPFTDDGVGDDEYDPFARKGETTTAAETEARIEEELRDMERNARGDYRVAPHRGNPHHWKGYVVGPLDTLYAGGIFFVDIFLPRDYPLRPPVLQFRTPILHPNVDEEGYDGLDLLSDGWTPSSTVADVLNSELAMMKDPRFDDPVNGSMTRLFRANRGEYEELVREWTLRHAAGEEELDEDEVRSSIEEGSEEARRRCIGGSVGRLALPNGNGP